MKMVASRFDNVRQQAGAPVGKDAQPGDIAFDGSDAGHVLQALAQRIRLAIPEVKLKNLLRSHATL